MSDFQVGARIRYYGCYNENIEIVKATVIGFTETGLLKIETDESVGDGGRVGPGWTGHAHPRQCKKLRARSFRIGDKVRLTKEATTRHREQLEETYRVPGEEIIAPDAEILCIAMSDVQPLTGVICGINSYGSIRASIGNKFGTYDAYFEPGELERIK